MKSRYEYLKPKARVMRTKGKSLRDIELALGIPRSTLSGWLRTVPLSKRQKQMLDARWRKALVHARVGARRWHNAEKARRVLEANISGQKTLEALPAGPNTAELALALLYLGEGRKTLETGMGNSDPEILRFFVTALQNEYQVPLSKIVCSLHLRHDQNEDEMKKFWSKQIGVPICQFRTTSFDKRTAGKKTYPTYKGVCMVRCGHVEIQRKLMYIARGYIESYISNSRG